MKTNSSVRQKCVHLEHELRGAVEQRAISDVGMARDPATVCVRTSGRGGVRAQVRVRACACVRARVRARESARACAPASAHVRMTCTPALACVLACSEHSGRLHEDWARATAHHRRRRSARVVRCGCSVRGVRREPYTRTLGACVCVRAPMREYA
eukprot:6181992-Pleurochrysis_carterae.AAC.2